MVIVRFKNTSFVEENYKGPIMLFCHTLYRFRREVLQLCLFWRRFN